MVEQAVQETLDGTSISLEGGWRTEFYCQGGRHYCQKRIGSGKKRKVKYVGNIENIGEEYTLRVGQYKARHGCYQNGHGGTPGDPARGA